MDADFSAVGRALAAPARSTMVSLLLDGQRHSAGELARHAGVASGTASGHLAHLVDAGLATVCREGRFRYYAIVDARTAAALEALPRPPEEPKVLSYRHSREQQRVRSARTCYDHLAGQLGVALTQTMVRRAWIAANLDEIQSGGEAGLADLGISVARLREARRPTLLACMDWTEREPHVSGGLGAALAQLAFTRHWVTRVPRSRGLRVTAEGSAAFEELGLWGAPPGESSGALG